MTGNQVIITFNSPLISNQSYLVYTIKGEFSLGADYADFTDILFVKPLLFSIL